MSKRFLNYVCALGVLALAGPVSAEIKVKMLDAVPEGAAVERAGIVLENPTAAAVLMPDGVALVGGIDNGRLQDRAVLVQDDGTTELPAFPHGISEAGAALFDGRLFVVGGVENLESMAVSKAMYSLNLSNPSEGWQPHPDLPGAARISPTLIASDGRLHVFGGWTADGPGQRVLNDNWGYRLKPVDGTTHRGWQALAPMPDALAQSAVFQSGQIHVALAGGFSAPDIASDRVLLYNTVTDTWVLDGVLPQAVGGGLMVGQDTQPLLIGPDGSAMELTLSRTVKTLGFMDYATMGIYFAFMAGIGIYFARKQNNSDEFALGNRNVKWWAAGVSMFATGASSISFMAIPAQVFRSNLVWFTPVIFIIPLTLLQAYIIYPLLRRLNLTSTYEYLEHRFHPSLRYVASAQMIIFQLIGRMSVVMLLPSLAISAVTGLPVLTSVLVMGVLTTIYTAFGGFEAVIWTDFSQGVLMLVGGALMILLAINGLPGGMAEFIEVGKTYNKFDYIIWNSDLTMPVFWVFGLQLVLQNLACASDQPVVQRVYATPLKDMRKLAGMFAFCAIAISVLACFSGLAIFAYFHTHPQLLDAGMSNDQIVPLYVVQRLPTGLAGLIIAALFAASMSTLSSSMNSVATVTCEDFYRKFFKGADDKSRLRFMKISSLVVGALGTGAAAYMASMNLSSMFETWNVLIGLVGGGFIGIYILGMFTKRTNAIGAVSGALVSIVVTLLVKMFSPLHYMFYMPVAVISCMSVGYLVSVVTGGHRKALAGLTVFDMRKGLEE
ncbi:Sodium/glucose cotransporter [Pontiella desulfatans]|uniref:Sodium/glucose cotransporter n=1 Tax=Pontiella desulfatans TaxID=2750659 RepID=A0A6C2U7X8_PONDE|nr:sodium/solute symporter [Pontiella desulfatans]VGO16212.1 Sodium/glucose cotransporter [Pontiella desulfatans]